MSNTDTEDVSNRMYCFLSIFGMFYQNCSYRIEQTFFLYLCSIFFKSKIKSDRRFKVKMKIKSDIHFLVKHVGSVQFSSATEWIVGGT